MDKEPMTPDQWESLAQEAQEKGFLMSAAVLKEQAIRAREGQVVIDSILDPGWDKE